MNEWTDSDRTSAAIMLLANVALPDYARGIAVIDAVGRWQYEIGGRPAGDRMEEIITMLRRIGAVPMTEAEQARDDNMSESKHTPGPWEVYQDSHCIAVRTKSRDEWRALNVCQFGNCDGILYQTLEETEANARLIAASLDLLEACQAMEDAVSGADQARAMTKIRAALAKARP